MCRTARNTERFVSPRYPCLFSLLFLLSANLPMNIYCSVSHSNYYLSKRGWQQIHSTCLIQCLIKATINRVLSIRIRPICSIDLNYATLGRGLIQPAKQIPKLSVYLTKSGGIFLTFLYWLFHLVQGINWGTIGCVSNYTDYTLTSKEEV